MSTRVALPEPFDQRPAVDRRMVLILSALACAGLGLAGLFPYNVPDTFGHLAQGRQIVELGRVPRLDTWSVIEPARPFYNYEWLSDVVFYALHRAFGSSALTILKILALMASGITLLRAARSLKGPAAQSLCAVLLIIAIPASRFRFTERPHVLGLLCASLAILLLLDLAGCVLPEARSRTRRYRSLHPAFPRMDR